LKNYHIGNNPFTRNTAKAFAQAFNSADGRQPESHDKYRRIKGEDGAVQNLIPFIIYGISKPICFFAGTLILLVNSNQIVI
jgi:hypothetical protein